MDAIDVSPSANEADGLAWPRSESAGGGPDDRTDAPSRSSSVWGGLAGFALLVGATLLALVSQPAWAAALEWAPPALAGETARWLTTALLGVAGLSFLRARPILVVVSGALFAFTAWCADLLLDHRLSGFINGLFGDGASLVVLPIAAAAFAFFVFANPRPESLSVRGITSLLLIALAALGTVRGWYDWPALAGYLGPTVSSAVSKWSEECIWATVLILTAVGVVSSRTKPIHFLNALLLGALAYHCVIAGYSETREFAELARGDYVPTIEFMSYKNVEPWQWVIAAELAGLGVLLLHLSLGLGALNVGFALAWMAVGLSVFNSIGRLSAAKLFSEGLVSAAAAPSPGPASAPPNESTANWGLPAGAAPASSTDPSQRTTAGPRTARPDAPADPFGAGRSTRQSLEGQRRMVISQIVSVVWIYLIAILAGLFAAGGLNQLLQDPRARIVLATLLAFAFGLALMAICIVWPRDSNQPWTKWFAAFLLSRYARRAIWVAFLGSTALASLGALALAPRRALWVNVSAAAILVGTVASLVGATFLIHFGGFPHLPAWVYVAIAAGQSSLAWVLLTHLNVSAKPELS